MTVSQIFKVFKMHETHSNVAIIKVRGKLLCTDFLFPYCISELDSWRFNISKQIYITDTDMVVCL